MKRVLLLVASLAPCFAFYAHRLYTFNEHSNVYCLNGHKFHRDRVTTSTVLQSTAQLRDTINFKKRTKDPKEEWMVKSPSDTSLSYTGAASDPMFQTIICSQCLFQDIDGITPTPINDIVEPSFPDPPPELFAKETYKDKNERFFISAVQNYVSPELRQVDESDIVYEVPGKWKELQVGDVVAHRCSIARSSMDVVYCSPNRGIMMGLKEFKLGSGTFGDSKTRRAIQQTSAYSIFAFAYSQWGVLMSPNTEWIVSLLVFPQCLYRLSFRKPSDVTEKPFGYEMKIEFTSDARMMGWVLTKYASSYADAYKLFQPLDLKGMVDPRSWSPVNYDFENGLAPFSQSKAPHLGFLFNTNADNLKDLQGLGSRLSVSELEKTPEGQPFYVKYLCSLLDTNYYACVSIMNELILRLISEENDRRIKELEQELLAARKVVNQNEPTSQILLADENAISLLVESTAIKHPYLAVWTVDTKHTLLLMRNVGQNLLEGIAGSNGLRQRWRTDAKLRRQFGVDIGFSAFNLVATFGICHTDIRIPNIAILDNEFCLLDFDMCSRSPRLDARQCLVLKGVRPELILSLHLFTIAQIALVVYALDTDADASEIAELRSAWLENAQTTPQAEAKKRFDNWIQGKGKLQQIFSEDESRKQALVMERADFVQYLELILDVTSLADAPDGDEGNA